MGGRQKAEEKKEEELSFDASRKLTVLVEYTEMYKQNWTYVWF